MRFKEKVSVLDLIKPCWFCTKCKKPYKLNTDLKHCCNRLLMRVYEEVNYTK